MRVAFPGGGDAFRRTVESMNEQIARAFSISVEDCALRAIRGPRVSKTRETGKNKPPCIAEVHLTPKETYAKRRRVAVAA